MSFGFRDRASVKCELSVLVIQNVKAVREAVSSIDWLDRERSAARVGCAPKLSAKSGAERTPVQLSWRKYPPANLLALELIRLVAFPAAFFLRIA